MAGESESPDALMITLTVAGVIVGVLVLLVVLHYLGVNVQGLFCCN